MKLKCILKKVDFVPMIKEPKFWVSPKTLSDGSILEVPDEIGHYIVAGYPGAFEVIGYDKDVKTRTKKVEAEQLVKGEAISGAEVKVEE